ncbi:undecaprenyldiphospho-muramoylpentapeptide beta-N-acetylglucosaminyltransferase [Dethiothermospora halolimnae]|uniref:undecaprenyldiphospho-muramoylpentapeptide beta-N-acetylglucosaminyltransferase n=1 Tax=Dethiothermospora halolimnae TaxID=3114390 RepID=UPI003CCC1706
MKFLISGGGTGGHIYPALSIAHRIKKDYPDADILYIGTEKSMEADIVPKEGFQFKTIRVKGFTRKISMDTLKTAKELLLGLNDARKIIKKYSPNIVIGTGGYVCGPLVLMASLKGVPTLIHEQNALPGVTNRILSRFVDQVAGSFDESKKYFKDNSKVTITGNPIRESILEIDKKEAYKKLKVDPNKKLVLVFGGSGGQQSLNDAMIETIKNHINNKLIQILHVTGKRHYDKFMNNLKKNDIDISSNNNIIIVPYLFQMPEAESISDLIITSGGAISIAEITAIGIPSIIVPKAYTTDNHQEFNARALEKSGASKMILEKDLNGQKLSDMIDSLLNDHNKLGSMARNSKKIGKTDAVDKIMSIVDNMIK